MNCLVGKVKHMDAEVIIIFRVNGKYYPATDSNVQLFETYLHTGNYQYLKDLTNEVEI